MKVDVTRDAAAWTACLRAGLAAAVVAVALGAVAAVWADPLWAFRREPPWLAVTGGANRVVDVEMRRAKPFWLEAAEPRLVLVGSSVAYRGLDPRDAEVPAFNFGMSALMASELPVVAALIAAKGSVRQVAIGLDYFMFTDFPPPPPLDPALATETGHWRARLGAVFSLRVLAGTVPAVLARAQEPGDWRRDGFKSTPDYPASYTRRAAAAEAAHRLAYRPETIAHLASALARLSGRDVRVYLSPQSPDFARIAAERGRGAGIAAWKRDVAAATAAAGVPLYDLTQAHPFGEYDPRLGSSTDWLDTLHFKPAVGRWVLRQLGLERHTP